MNPAVIKAKPCAFCESSFMPVRLMQRVCSPRCARRIVDAQKKVEKAKDKVTREKLKTKADWHAEAQKAVNAYVRARDAGEPCISCGRIHEGQWHAGHYRSRGSAKHLALDVRNIHRQCAPCNDHLHGNAINYRIGLIGRYGVEFVEAIECDDTPRLHTIDDLKAIRKNYADMTKQLKKEQE